MAMTDEEEIEHLQAIEDAVRAVKESLMANKSPTMVFSVTPTEGVFPLPTTGSYSGARAQTVVWSWGDGSASTGVTATHTYQTQGDFTVTCKATNRFGSVSGTQIISVSAPVVVPPPTPTKVITPFDAEFVSVPLEPIDATKNQLFQRFDTTNHTWELMIWQDNEVPNEILIGKSDGSTIGMTGLPLPAGFVETCLTTPSGTFTYGTFCHSDDSMNNFTGECLHYRQEVSYHFYTRQNIAWYWVINGQDDDLITTRVLSEQINPFLPNTTGIVVFMGHDRWDVRCWHNNQQVFQNSLDWWSVQHGFANSPFRSSGNCTPDNPDWVSHDNGTDADFLKTHPVEFFFERQGDGTHFKIMENANTKSEGIIPVVIENLHPMPAPGAYHIVNNGVDDLLAMQAAGHNEPQLLEWAKTDKTIHRFGPMTLEFLPSMPNI